MEHAVPQLRGPRVRDPRGRVTGRDDVHVANEEQPPTARPPKPADDDRQGAARHLLARPVRVGAGRRGVRREAFMLHTDVGEQRGNKVLDRLLRAGHAGDPDEVAKRSDRPVGVDPLRRAGVVPCPGHPRRIGRVRQVGPPEPLMPISAAG